MRAERRCSQRTLLGDSESWAGPPEGVLETRSKGSGGLWVIGVVTAEPGSRGVGRTMAGYSWVVVDEDQITEGICAMCRILDSDK